jgi:hypothetical protein
MIREGAQGGPMTQAAVEVGDAMAGLSVLVAGATGGPG